MRPDPDLPAAGPPVVVAQGDLAYLRELTRWLGARGIQAELQRPPERPGAGRS